ncbi:MAG TPA: gluconate 2-dehydrogenase subunit 3 family protein [Woeseiaceae bacterium]|nr:gluconate 2-dehydrogenase subunit 3 family protein [Woeseiaceae bacterium]
MTQEPETGVRVDRRTTIKWLAATMAAAWTGCSSHDKFLGSEIPGARTTSRLGVAATPDDIGYGTDPDLITPVVPWSRTMTRAQLRTSTALCDAILPADERSPAASAVGVPDFIDEWISAPYPQQREDRELVLSGLEWLEQESVNRFGPGFAVATEHQKTELMELIATTTDVTPDLADRVEFFQRFRYLAVGAYYTSEAGIADVGYIGNVPIAGSYPGPSDEAMAHLAAVLEQLGLSLPGSH